MLARAARTTASFPIAFGPSTLPLDWTTDVLSDDPGGLTATPRMDAVLETRGGKTFDPGPGPKSSRFAIDGGLWDNSPFSAVLRAIDRTPSDRDVARRVTYVVATSDPPAKAAPESEPGLVASVTEAVALPANVAFANDLERIEADLGQQERRREIVPRLLGAGPPDLFVLAAELFPLYRERLIEDGEVGAAPLDALPGPEAPPAEWMATSADWRWGIQPVRVAVQEARRLLREVLRELAADAAAGPRHGYEPARGAGAAVPARLGRRRPEGQPSGRRAQRPGKGRLRPGDA